MNFVWASLFPSETIRAASPRSAAAKYAAATVSRTSPSLSLPTAISRGAQAAVSNRHLCSISSRGIANRARMKTARLAST